MDNNHQNEAGTLHPQSHDSFFKAAFSQPPVTAEFVETFVPAPVVARLDLVGMVLDKLSYVDEQLSSYYSDLVWNVPYRHGQKTITVKVALLFEHKSTPAKYIHLQLLRYMLAIWTKNIENKEDLVPIIPIVIYQSRKKWKKRNFADLFKGIDEHLLPYLPAFEYERTDVTPEAEQLLFEAQRFRAMSVFKTMFHVTWKLLTRSDLRTFFSLTKTVLGNGKELGDLDRQLQTYILSYIFAHSDVPPQVVEEDVEASFTNPNKNMSTLEQFRVLGKAAGKAEGIAEGKAEGIAEGKAKGIAEGKAEGKAFSAKVIKLYLKGYTIDAIVSELKTTLEEVKEAVDAYENA